jgi:hypothetical protein
VKSEIKTLKKKVVWEIMRVTTGGKNQYQICPVFAVLIEEG